MKKILCFMVAMFVCWGCANAVDGEAEHKDPDKTDPTDPGVITPEQPKKECTLLGTLRCNGNKKREKCVEGSWVAYDECAATCVEAECVEESHDVTCEHPAALSLGVVVQAHTATGSESVSLGTMCRGAAPSAGSEMIYSLDIPAVGLYDFTVDVANENNGYALYVQQTCGKAESIVKDSCMYSYTKGSKTVSVLLNPGKYFVIVDSPNAALDTQFSLLAKKAENPPMKVCVNKADAVVQYPDLSRPVTIQGSIRDGQSQMNWDTRAGCNSVGTGGKELVYTFRLDTKKTVTAALSMVPVEESTAQNTLAGAMYILSCGADSSVMTQCKDTKAGDPLSFSKELEPGMYSLVVDSAQSNPKGDFSFTLQLSAQ